MRNRYSYREIESFAASLDRDYYSNTRKRPFNRQEFAHLIKGNLSKGALEVCDYILEALESDLTREEIKGEVHLMRLDIYNGYAASPMARIKPATLEDAMTLNPEVRYK